MFFFVGLCSNFVAAQVTTSKRLANFKLNNDDNFQYKENYWIAEQVFRDIIEILWFAKNQQLVDQQKITIRIDKSKWYRAFAFDIKFPGLEGEISCKLEGEYLWSPEYYRPLVKKIIKELQLQASSEKADENLIFRLLNSGIEDITKEEVKLTKLLNHNPLCGIYHTQAAMVIGFVLSRESAANYADNRLLLSRMTAHLALAESLEGQANELFLGANVLLSTFTGKQINALAAIKKMEKKYFTYNTEFH